MYQRGFLFDVVRNHTRNDQHCDLKILCGDDTYFVHRFILYFQSDFFAKVCEGRALEQPKQELTLSEPSVLVDQMIKFFYEGAYAPVLEPPALSAWMNQRAQAQATGSQVVGGVAAFRVVDPSADPKITTAVYHLAMHALAGRMMVPALKEEAREAAVRCLRELPTLQILEHCLPEVYGGSDGADSTPVGGGKNKDGEQEEGIRSAITGVIMDKLIYQTPVEEKARISAANEALMEAFPAYARDLEAKVLERESEVSDVRAGCGLY